MDVIFVVNSADGKAFALAVVIDIGHYWTSVECMRYALCAAACKSDSWIFLVMCCSYPIYIYMSLRYTGINMKLLCCALKRFGSIVWSMWGHPAGCSCPTCHSLERSFQLLREIGSLPGFGSLALGHVRVFEAELRDALAWARNQGRPPSPKGPQEEKPQPPAEPPVAAAAAPPEKGTASSLPPPGDGEPGSSGSCLFPKSKPSEPSRAGSEIKLKVEPTSSPDHTVDVEAFPAEPSSPAKPRNARGESKDRDKAKRKKDKRRTRSRSRRRDKPRGEHRSPRNRSARRRSRRAVRSQPGVLEAESAKAILRGQRKRDHL